jgi:hypothetical protein
LRIAFAGRRGRFAAVVPWCGIVGTGLVVLGGLLSGPSVRAVRAQGLPPTNIPSNTPTVAPIPAANADKADENTEARLHEAAAALETGVTADALRASKILRGIVPATLSGERREKWRTAARTAAVRTGDTVWLKAINEAERIAAGLPYEAAGTYLVETARGYLEAGDLVRSREFLAYFQRDYLRFGERDQRRWLALSVRLARLDGDTKTERKLLEQLVEYPSMWPMQTCRECHANPAAPKSLALLDVRKWWAGERYAELLKQSGEAAALRDKLAARLKAYPDDAAVRLQLVYVLQALGKPDEADDLLRLFPWATFPERSGPKAVNVRAYP